MQRLTDTQGYHPFYHAVTDESPPHIEHLVVPRTVKEFSADLDCLLKYFTPVTLKDMADAVTGCAAMPRYPMLLTIDDGLREAYEVIAPILVEKGVPAAFYLCSAFVDNKELGWKNKVSVLIGLLENSSTTQQQEIRKILQLADSNDGTTSVEKTIRRLKYSQRELLDKIAPVLDVSFTSYLSDYQPYMTSGQIQTLLSQGFSIGAHSVDHPQYSELDDALCLRQSVACMDWLEKQFAVKTRSFAHPFSNVGLSRSHMHALLNDGRFELLLGTSSGKRDIDPRILQRNPVENRKQGPMEGLIESYIWRRAARRLTGKNIMERVA